MPITTSNNLKLALRGYAQDGTTAASTVRTQIGSGWKLKVYKTSGDTEIATGTASGSLGGTGVNITGTVSLTGSGSGVPGTDSMYARVEKSDGTVWIRGTVGATGSGADCILSGPIVDGGIINASIALDFPATGGGGGGTPPPNPDPDPPPTDPNYKPSLPPRGVKTNGWLRRSTDPGFYVPLYFVGLHRDGAPEGASSSSNFSAPNFTFGAVRNHDAIGSNYSVANQWARIDPSANGSRSWTHPDNHQAHSDVDGKPLMWTHLGTPPGYQKYPIASTQSANADKEYFPYPYIHALDAYSWNSPTSYAPVMHLNGGGSPPADGSLSAFGSYVAAVCARYDNVKWFELLNEPDFGLDGTGSANTYDTTRADKLTNSQGWDNYTFFTGTAQDAVKMAKVAKDNLPSGVKLAVGGFVYQDTINAYWGDMRNAVYRYMTCPHPTDTGKKGRDYVDVFTFHTYFNTGSTVNKTIQEIRNYKSLLTYCGVSSTIPLINSEAGWLGGSSTSANASFTGKQCARLLLIHAGLGVSAVFLYKWARQAWMAFCVDWPVVGQEIDKVTSIAGKTVRQAAELDDDTVWVECEDGTQYRA